MFEWDWQYLYWTKNPGGMDWCEVGEWSWGDTWFLSLLWQEAKQDLVNSLSFEFYKRNYFHKKLQINLLHHRRCDEELLIQRCEVEPSPHKAGGLAQVVAEAIMRSWMKDIWGFIQSPGQIGFWVLRAWYRGIKNAGPRKRAQGRAQDIPYLTKRMCAICAPWNLEFISWMWQNPHARKGEAQGVLSYQKVKGIFDNPPFAIIWGFG